MADHRSPTRFYGDVEVTGDVIGTDTPSSVRVATVAPGNLALDFRVGDTIDGVVFARGDRIFLKNQALGIENGIYLIQFPSAPPVRSVDMAAGSRSAGKLVTVEEGSQADTLWICTTNSNADVVGTNALAFGQIAGTGVTHARLHGLNSALDHSAGTASTVEGTNSGGALAEIPFDSAATPGALALRNGAGDVVVPTTPSSATAAASKAYVDSVATGLDVKAAVRGATTVPGVLATDFEAGDTLDGTITLAAGDRILVKDQASSVENGIRVVQPAGAPTRATDLAAGSSAAGAFVFVLEGATQADTGWVCSSDPPADIVGTDPLAWTQFAAPNVVVAGDGIDKVGNVISVDSSDIAGAGIEDDGANNLRITTQGDGIAGGGGTSLSVSVAALVGAGLEDDGANNIRIAAAAAGDGLGGGAGSPLSADVAVATLAQQYGGLVKNRTSNGTAVAAADAGFLAVQTDNVTLEVNASNQVAVKSGGVPGTLGAPVVTSSVSDTTTASTTDVLLAGMSITPGAGNYLVWFSGSFEVSNDNREIEVSIYAAALEVADSVRTDFSQKSTDDFTISTHAFVTVAGGESIEVRWRVSIGATTATAHTRSMITMKVN